MVKSARGRAAFTLVELLVVIGIIAVMISMLLPALNRVRSQSQQTACASNLRVWGQALHTYAAENKGKMPLTWGRGSQPTAIWADTRSDIFSGGRNSTPEWSIDKIAPYIKGFRPPENAPFGRWWTTASARTWPLSGVWMCPSVVGGGNASAAPAWFLQPSPVIAAHMHYAYFYGYSQWNPSSWSNSGSGSPVPFPEHITDLKFSPKRILMADSLFYTGFRSGSARGWVFNHAKRGAGGSFFTPDGYMDVVTPIDSFAGMNQLYGDGSVRWVSASDMPIETWKTNPSAGPRVHETFYAAPAQ